MKSGPGKVKAVNPVAAALSSTGHTDLPGVFFEFGKAIIRPDSEPALQQAADALTEHPDWKVRIEGYTDSVGGAAYNLRLSQRRAEAVQQALEQKHGIATGRLTAKGFGGASPKASNDTEDGRAKNRRVELVKLTAS